MARERRRRGRSDRRKPLAVVQQHFQHMQRRKLLVAVAHGERLRRLIKPRERSVYFSIFIVIFLSLLLRPEGTDCSIFIGFSLGR